MRSYWSRLGLLFQYDSYPQKREFYTAMHTRRTSYEGEDSDAADRVKQQKLRNAQTASKPPEGR